MRYTARVLPCTHRDHQYGQEPDKGNNNRQPDAQLGRRRVGTCGVDLGRLGVDVDPRSSRSSRSSSAGEPGLRKRLAFGSQACRPSSSTPRSRRCGLRRPTDCLSANGLRQAHRAPTDVARRFLNEGEGGDGGDAERSTRSIGRALDEKPDHRLQIDRTRNKTAVASRSDRAIR